jgi:hypothetical protein
MLAAGPRIKVSLGKIVGSVVDIGAGGEGVIAKTCGAILYVLTLAKRK